MVKLLNLHFACWVFVELVLNFVGVFVALPTSVGLSLRKKRTDEVR